MEWFKKYFIGGIPAGMLIGISTTMYLMCPNKTVGAFLFSGGLLAICLLRLTLFTGAIGYVMVRPAPVLPGLVGNLVGMFGVALVIKYYDPNVYALSNQILLNTIADGPIRTIISAVFCGMLMFIAVHIFNIRDSVLGIVTAIPCFVICGFDHSIVNMFHWAMSSNLYEFAVGSMVVGVSLMGNTIGALLMYLLFDGFPKKKKEGKVRWVD